MTMMIKSKKGQTYCLDDLPRPTSNPFTSSTNRLTTILFLGANHAV